MRVIRWLDAARGEAVDAARAYAETDPKLGEALWRQVERTLALVQRFPETGQLVVGFEGNTLRRHFVLGFDYTLVVMLRPDDAVVVAFHHQRRDPRYWENRTNGARR